VVKKLSSIFCHEGAKTERCTKDFLCAALRLHVFVANFFKPLNHSGYRSKKNREARESCVRSVKNFVPFVVKKIAHS
jgi:hypothetical protein